MNITLFGYILAWLGVIYCIITVISTYYHYKGLSTIQQRDITYEINIQLITFLISVAYIATYHIS